MALDVQYLVHLVWSSGKLVAVIGDEDTVTGFLLAGTGHRTNEGANFLVVKPGKNTVTLRQLQLEQGS